MGSIIFGLAAAACFAAAVWLSARTQEVRRGRHSPRRPTPSTSWGGPGAWLIAGVVLLVIAVI
jgi:hypothetical protein